MTKIPVRPITIKKNPYNSKKKIHITIKKII